MTDERLPLAHALALGVIQGPAELLPISSSGHLVLVPAICGWRYGELDPEIRKAFEVALHAGGAAALLIGLRREVAEYLRSLGPRNLVSLTLSFAPDRTVLGDYYFVWGDDEEQAAIALGTCSLCNHSYRPNTVFRLNRDKLTIEFVAARGIEAGEEITINYNGDPNSKKPIWFECLE